MKKDKREEIRPRQLLTDVAKDFPDVWRNVKTFRDGKGKDLPNWEDWCYLPMAASYSIASQTGVGFNSRYSNPMAVISAAASWRVSQGVYKFDADLHNSLIEQNLDGDIPSEVLKRLPEWCVYIETIGLEFLGSKIEGFFAHLEQDMNDQRSELRLLMMLENDKVYAMAIHLGGTIKEGLDNMIKESRRVSGINLPSIDFSSEITPMIQLVLYLCAENADMVRPVHPLTKARAMGAIDPPRKPRKWEVGVRIGTSIRKYRNDNTEQNEHTETKEGSHTSKRPHVRKAHWATYWTGSKKEQQTPILKWLPPIPVNLEDQEDDNPAVIHKVE